MNGWLIGLCCWDGLCRGMHVVLNRPGDEGGGGNVAVVSLSR